MLRKKTNVSSAIRKGAGGIRRVAGCSRQPLQEPRGDGFRPGRQAFALSDDTGKPTHRLCRRLDRPPSVRSVTGRSRKNPAKTLPVETIKFHYPSSVGGGKCRRHFLVGGSPPLCFRLFKVNTGFYSTSKITYPVIFQIRDRSQNVLFPQRRRGFERTALRKMTGNDGCANGESLPITNCGRSRR